MTRMTAVHKQWRREVDLPFPPAAGDVVTVDGRAWHVLHREMDDGSDAADFHVRPPYGSYPSDGDMRRSGWRVKQD